MGEGVGAGVGDGVGEGVGLHANTPHRQTRAPLNLRARMAADRPSHLGVGVEVGTRVGVAVGEAVGAAVVGVAVGEMVLKEEVYFSTIPDAGHVGGVSPPNV